MQEVEQNRRILDVDYQVAMLIPKVDHDGLSRKEYSKQEASVVEGEEESGGEEEEGKFSLV